jgi:hypothetical protein
MMAHNGLDVISVDVPLMLRLMEFAREDATSDKDLHFVAEHLVRYMQTNTLLTMKHYDMIVDREGF